jgi:hypothetical protein
MKVCGELHDPAILLSGMRAWINSIGGCVGPMGGLDIQEKEKNTPLTRIEILRSSRLQVFEMFGLVSECDVRNAVAPQTITTVGE